MMASPTFFKGWRTKLSRAIHEFSESRRAAGKSPATVAGYESDLHGLSHALPTARDTVLDLNETLIQAYFVAVSQAGRKMSTLHRKAASVREFVRWGIRLKIWSPDLLEVIPRIRRPEPLPRPFTPEEATRLWKLDLPQQQRLFRALLFFSGLRISSICAIRLGDLVETPPAIRVTVKGGRSALKPLHPKLEAEIQNYVLSCSDLKPQSPLLARANGKPLTRKLAARMTHEWGRRAQVPACLPHRFRHTFATEQLRAGVDIRVIQKALDHIDIKSTTVYTKVHDEQIREAILRLPEAWGESP
jgi:site-specific recombinase XerD